MTRTYADLESLDYEDYPDIIEDEDTYEIEDEFNESDESDEIDTDDENLYSEDEEIQEPEPKSKDKTIKVKPRSTKADYVNEHDLCIKMTMFKNWDGKKPKSEIFSPENKQQRAKYEIAKARYDALINQGIEKRNPQVQEAFNESLHLAINTYPSDRDIEDLYRMINLICGRCINLYGRNYNIDIDDLKATVFERWMKYAYNFDPTKRSKISGTRVNAFAYMTQVVKNVIYDFVNKADARAALAEKLKNDYALYESKNSLTPILNTSEETDVKVVESDYDSGLSVDTQDVMDSDIIKTLMDLAPNHVKLRELIMDTERKGFTKDEIFGCIGRFDLIRPLNEVITNNKWAF